MLAGGVQYPRRDSYRPLRRWEPPVMEPMRRNSTGSRPVSRTQSTVTNRSKKRSSILPPSTPVSTTISAFVAYVFETIVSIVIPLLCSILGWFGSWLRWVPTSMAALQTAERRVLSFLKTSYTGRFVDIGNRVGNKDNRVWTIIINEKSPNTPLVMVHGFGAGVGLWVLNLDTLAKNRPVYAMDILGFGRSSRPSFSSDALEAETQLVESFEDWRQQMKLDKFILLGHSMGGFLVTSYALRYPERVKHLILADPWGFSERLTEKRNYQLPTWVKAVITILQPFNPLAGLRAAGPWGPRLIEKLRPDLQQKFASVTEDDVDAIPNYIYHCNAQNPSGEAAFKAMTEHFGWAKWPMMPRTGGLHSEIPITFIYGSRSWIDRTPGYEIKNTRRESKVAIHVLQGAGHHVYADQPHEFNLLVTNICNEECDILESYQNGVVIKDSTKPEVNGTVKTHTKSSPDR